MQLNNVLSVVTRTYRRGGGVGFWAGGNHEEGVKSGREMAFLCAWLFSFLATLSFLSTLRLPSVLVRQRIIYSNSSLPCQHDLLYWLYILNFYTICLWFFNSIDPDWPWVNIKVTAVSISGLKFLWCAISFESFHVVFIWYTVAS